MAQDIPSRENNVGYKNSFLGLSIWNKINLCLNVIITASLIYQGFKKLVLKNL